MKSMFVVACALLVAAQANSSAQDKDAKTVRVIVLVPQVPGTNAGKVAKAIKTGAFTEIDVAEAKSTAVKLTDVMGGKGEKPALETYQRQKIAVVTKGEKYTNEDVWFPATMTKGVQLTKFVEKGKFQGKMGSTISHHYVIYEATIVRK